jgi:hypothetical protein
MKPTAYLYKIPVAIAKSFPFAQKSNIKEKLSYYEKLHV